MADLRNAIDRGQLLWSDEFSMTATKKVQAVTDQGVIFV